MPATRKANSARPGPATPGGTDGLAVELERLRAIVEDLRTENEHVLEAQRLLEAGLDEYVDLFESAPLPALILDERGGVRAANQMAAGLLGRSPSDLVGRRLSQLIAPADRTRLAAHLAGAVRNHSGTCEVRLRVADEEGRAVELHTRRAARSRAVQTILVDLAGRERERIERVELRDAVASAERANAAKDRFIAMLSHELRTPLTPVLIAASALRDQQELPQRARNAFAMIARSIQLESRLVDDLLDVTRIAQGKMRVERTPSDLHAIVRRACETLAPELHTKQQSLWTELKADEFHVEADPVRMHQLFTNLLRNAIKFSPIGGEIFVRSWDAGARIMVEVEDRGVGMDPAEVARVFEPFSQLEPEAAPAVGRSGGLGLGLTIAKGIVDLHGGRIEAASRGRGLGARFVVQLPTTKPPSARAEAPAAPPAAPPHDPTKCKILLVEDDHETAQIVAELLKGEGYDVAQASTVREALAVDVDAIDVIVSDLGLPDGDGRDLIRRLQASHHHAAIALSGYGMGQDVAASLAAGFDVHLTKPVNFDELVGTIRGLAGKGAPGAASRRGLTPPRPPY